MSTTIVLEFATSAVKAGFAGDRQPKVINAGELGIKYPLNQDTITNWEDYEKVVAHVFNNVLKVNPSEYCVIFELPALATAETKAKVAEILFNKFNVQSVYIANKATLSLFVGGFLNGLVYYSDNELSYLVPVNNGFAVENKSVQLNECSAKAIVDCISKCDAKLHKALYGCIYPAGVKSVGLEGKLQKEVSALAPSDVTVKVIETSQAEHAAWIGGSILGAVPGFADKLLTHEEYKKKGAAAVAEKF